MSSSSERIEIESVRPGTRLSSIRGVGPKTAEALSAAGLVTAQDALLFLPRAYEDRRFLTPIALLRPGELASVRGCVARMSTAWAGKRRRVFEVVIADGTRALSLRWFQFQTKVMESRFRLGMEVVASASVSKWGSTLCMVHPEVVSLRPPPDPAPWIGEIVPIYREVEGVKIQHLRNLIRGIASACATRISDPLPDVLRDRLSLPMLPDAVVNAHLPVQVGLQDASCRFEGPSGDLLRRLVFDELFYLQLALAKKRAVDDDMPGLCHAGAERWEAVAEAMFPFALTGAQVRVLSEISTDLAASRPMNRLLQGDVGSGKTAVALIAASQVVASGRQVALLAPTEILAEQHHRTASLFFGRAGRVVALLTGSARSAAREASLQSLASGSIDLLIGTHAILEPDVVFHDLGLVIIDEQHRFGVAQRAKLRNKRKDALVDTLVMTATPIPRTLALTLYGDLRVSVMDELPPGREVITTRIYKESERALVIARLLRAVEAGRQAYVVVPLVEASEKIDLLALRGVFESLSSALSPHPVGALHGRMKAKEKSAVMDAFSRGEVSVLVSTTVVEVGVDVANASVMVVEHAERFGLSQIHQLRGRVGRGVVPGECAIVVGSGAGQDVMDRLSVLESSSDGFVIAEHDLKTRGSGDLWGTRQAGLPDLLVANLVRDARVLEDARKEAFAMIEADRELALPAHSGIRRELVRRHPPSQIERLALADGG